MCVFFFFSVRITQMLGRGGCLGSPHDPQTQRDGDLLRPEPVQGALRGQSPRAVALAAQTPAAPGLLPRAGRDREPGPAFFLFQGAAGRERTASSSLPATSLPTRALRSAGRSKDKTRSSPSDWSPLGPLGTNAMGRVSMIYTTHQLISKSHIYNILYALS